MNLRSSEKQSLKSVPSQALAAVAYQDHLLKDLSIGDLTKSLTETKLSVTDNLRLKEKRRKLALRRAKPAINTGLKKRQIVKPKELQKEDAEYVLDPQPKPLSLAQKFGLVPHNKDQEKLLSEKDWKSLKETSEKRNDFKNPCVICKDDFRLEDQVLLSCSHFFHKTCLQAFERFTGRKTCPMCRHESYQTRVVHDGTKHYKHKSATRIQAHWRGYVVRKWYQKLRMTVPPKDQKLRRKFYEKKLVEITNRMVAMTSSDRIDRFLNDMDQTLAHSRNVFQHFDKSILSHVTDDEWMKIEERAVARGATGCPICLRSLELSESSHQESSQTHKDEDGYERKSKESISLLSCSHVFHATCLNALEIFSVDGCADLRRQHRATDDDQSFDFVDARPSSSFKCPVCRAIYLKRIVSF